MYVHGHVHVLLANWGIFLTDYCNSVSSLNSPTSLIAPLPYPNVRNYVYSTVLCIIQSLKIGSFFARLNTLDPMTCLMTLP